MTESASTIVCPECGRDMILRTARRGPRSGRQFYGCSGYPNYCRHIVNIDDTEVVASNNASGEAAIPPQDRLDLPKVVRAVSAKPNLQNKYFQAISVPHEISISANYTQLDRRFVRAAAQWRLDYPLPKHIPSNELNTLISVCEGILTRGSIAYCSIETEKYLNWTNPIGVDGISESHWLHAVIPKTKLKFHQFDSEEERAFYNLIESFIADSGVATWHITPQVEIASLLHNTSRQDSNARVDFLISNPNGESFIVEVDGAQHSSQEVSDAERDRLLTETGLGIARVPVEEIRQGIGSNLEYVKQLIVDGSYSLSTEKSTDLFASTIVKSKWMHQIQLILLEALRGGVLSQDEVWDLWVIPPDHLSSVRDRKKIASTAIDEFIELMGRLSNILGLSFSGPSAVKLSVSKKQESRLFSAVISPSDTDDILQKLPPSAAVFYFSDSYVPRDIQAPLTYTDPIDIDNPSESSAEWFLQYIFRKESFRPGQWDVIQRTLKGNDSVVLLPTGAGKSIAFQLSALLLPGRCLVVDPIISLIEDQIDNLAQYGIDRCLGISSMLSLEQRLQAYESLTSGHYQFCYIAPERLQMKEFRERLTALTGAVPINSVIIDEAHCVSEWGHDFRTAYLNLGRNARDLCRRISGSSPPIVALTGTASKLVLKDVQRELNIVDLEAIITPDTFDRAELNFTILECKSSEKHDRAIGFLNSLPSKFGISESVFFSSNGPNTAAGMIFCPHVNGQYGVYDYSTIVSQKVGVSAGIYSGSSPNRIRNDDWDSRKSITSQLFKRDKVPLMVCTKAFGMGIDKSNVRYTVHVGLPPSIESFYQEAGRSGRDKQRAECCIVLSNDDKARTERLLAPGTSVEDIATLVNDTKRDDSDDVMRCMWFHTNAFSGISDETEAVSKAISLLSPSNTRQANKELSWLSEDKLEMEKALHKLVVLGVVEDYTVEYSKRVFEVTLSGADKQVITQKFCDYVGSYQRGLVEEWKSKLDPDKRQNLTSYILHAAKLLVTFIYDHIERSRRSSMREMLLACESAKGNGEILRSRILQYLEHSEFDEAINTLLQSDVGGLDNISVLLDELVSAQHASALRGNVGRTLTSYPNVPGLLFLRAISEELSADRDKTVVLDSLSAGVRFAIHEYNIDPIIISSSLRELLSITALSESRKDEIINNLFSSTDMTVDLARAMIKDNNQSRTVSVTAALWMVRNLKNRVEQVIT